MKTLRILIIALCRIFWALSANDVQAVPIQSNLTEATALQGTFARAPLDLPTLIGQAYNSPFALDQGVTTRLVLDAPALLTASLQEDSANFRLLKPSSSTLTKYTFQTNVLISNSPVTASNVAYAYLTQSEGLVIVDRSVSEPQPSPDWARDIGIDASIYDFQYSFSIGYPRDFGFWYPSMNLWYPSYNLLYSLYGFWDPFRFWYVPVIDVHHHSEGAAALNSVGRFPHTIPEPATLVLLGLGALITLRS